MPGMTEYYLLFIWSDVEPELYGPFETKEERNTRALELKDEYGDKCGIHWLDVHLDLKGYTLDVGAYSERFLNGNNLSD